MGVTSNDDKNLLAVWQRAREEGDDGLRRLMERVVQQVLEVGDQRFFRAAPYERTVERRGCRNGYEPRLLKMWEGTLELLMPNDCEGQFQTGLFERNQRPEKALLMAIVQMYVQGVSTRKVREISEALCGLEISKSQVSAPAKSFDEEVSAWRRRPLSRACPYLVIKACYERVRRHGGVITQGFARGGGHQRGQLS